MREISPQTFYGRVFSREEIIEINEIVSTCRGLSRAELANTVCELLSWKRPSGKLKSIECRQFLDHLESKGIIRLPEIRKHRPKGSKVRIQRTDKCKPLAPVGGSAGELFPLRLTRVETKEKRDLWYEYVDRYHYLGYTLPFGAQLRYFMESRKIADTILGCLQFSSPAWRMAPRDKWIGWNDAQRQQNLQKIINNSRFLIFPWIKVKNLASAEISLAAKVVPSDWEECYGYRPVLLETLVDQRRFKGTCYQAANWVHLGTTTGRGRMDRDNRRYGVAPKEIYVYPLSRKFRDVLRAL